MIPKFRAYIKKSKKIYPVNDLTLNGIDDEPVGINGCGDSTCTTCLDWYRFEDIELMQSTGLKDKNGVDIFEGDICIQRGEEPYSDENMTLDEDWEYKGVIIFQDFAYWIKDDEGFVKWLGTDCDEIEVIGNIYENRELLEVEE